MKYENIDLIAALETIMKSRTEHYTKDFEVDKTIIQVAAKSENPEDKRLFWFCRKNGTHCLREREIFMEDSRENNTFKYYVEQSSEKIMPYLVVVTGEEAGKVIGNLYPLDYQKEYEEVKKHAVVADKVCLKYEQGTKEQPRSQFFGAYPDPVLGNFMGYELKPNDPVELEAVRRDFKSRMERMKPGDIGCYLSSVTGKDKKASITSQLRKSQAEIAKRKPRVLPQKKAVGMEL